MAPVLPTVAEDGGGRSGLHGGGSSHRFPRSIGSGNGRHPLASTDSFREHEERRNELGSGHRRPAGDTMSGRKILRQQMSVLTEKHRLCAKPRWHLMRILDSWQVQALLIFVILVDVLLAISQIVADVTNPNHDEPVWMFSMTLFIVFFLLIEVLLRLWGLGPKTFFSRWYNSVDLLVSVMSMLLEIIVWVALQHQLQRLREASAAAEAAAAAVAASGQGAAAAVNGSLSGGLTSLGGDSAAAAEIAMLRVLRPIARIVRFLRIFTRAFSQNQRVGTTARHIVGGNKRRFQQSGFDLDLVYVTEQLIGMSVPAVGGMSMYRNPIDEVARFFKTYHAGAYMLFNCTSECSYPVEPFNGNVKRYAIDDHNVPLMEVVVAFCQELESLAQER